MLGLIALFLKILLRAGKPIIWTKNRDQAKKYKKIDAWSEIVRKEGTWFGVTGWLGKWCETKVKEAKFTALCTVYQSRLPKARQAWLLIVRFLYNFSAGQKSPWLTALGPPGLFWLVKWGHGLSCACASDVFYLGDPGHFLSQFWTLWLIWLTAWVIFGGPLSLFHPTHLCLSA